MTTSAVATQGNGEGKDFHIPVVETIINRLVTKKLMPLLGQGVLLFLFLQDVIYATDQ